MTETEAVGKILTHMHEEPAARLFILRSDSGDSQDNDKWTIGYEFGEEEPGSKMYAGASYFTGDNLAVIAEQVLEEVGIKS